VGNLNANCRARALLCYRVFFGAAPAEVGGVRELLERAIRWRRLAESMRDPALAGEMQRIAESYLDLAERAQLTKFPAEALAAVG
jgi:hypothetical protein